MKKFFLLIVAITLHQSLQAQEDGITNKLFYAELGGPGVIMSANFDARFKKERLGFGCRLGLGYGVGDFKEERVYQGGYYDDYVRRTYYSIPAGLNYVFGKPNSSNTFEVGAGVTFLTRKVSLYYYDVKEPGHAIVFLTFMYRVVPVNGGFSFRIGLTPIIGTAGDLYPMGSIGFGYAF